MAWNKTQSAILSGTVSGRDSDPGLIRSTIGGPDLLTGGSFGLETSNIALLCTAARVILLGIEMRRGQTLPPPWNR